MGRVVSNNGQQYYVTADDWVDTMFRNSLRQNYNISAQGANEKGNMLSFNYLNNEGYYLRFWFRALFCSFEVRVQR